jgi:precorrin-6B methylase 2
LLLLEVKKCNYNFKNFIDIGSGKGKACFYVHINFSFRKIIGIEFSESLFSIANKNKLKIDAKNVQFINTDASIFKLPNHPNLIFMFNPFDEIILEKLILNNMFHFKRYRSVIAYANDKHRSILTKHGFKIIFRDSLRKISIYKLP